MNFKDEYKREFDDVRMDEAFKNRLADEMNQIAPARRNYKVYATVLAVAAALLAVVGIGRMGKVDAGGDFGMKAEVIATEATAAEGAEAGTVSADGTKEGIFAAGKWYKDAVSDEEIYAEFARLMESGTLEKLYCSDKETFKEEDIVSRDVADELAGKLAAAVVSDGELAGTAKNYMAVFANGEIVKFQVSDEGYVKLNDIKTVYQYEKQ